MSEHTKGRWYRFIKPNGRASVRLEETGETLASDLSPADAERIVLMHASHEALVSALERIEQAARSRETRLGDPCGLIEVRAELEAAAKRARTALALASGK